jgi:hypothetical protein
VRLVPDGDVAETLARQFDDSLRVYRGISSEQSRFQYEPGKWTIRQVLGHISDAERVFQYRAVAFARGETQPLPGFDQDVWMKGVDFDGRGWDSLIEEFSHVRASTIALFRGLEEATLDRRGIASDNPVSVRALGFIAAGHERHHLDILQNRYFASRSYPAQ